MEADVLGDGALVHLIPISYFVELHSSYVVSNHQLDLWLLQTVLSL